MTAARKKVVENRLGRYGEPTNRDVINAILAQIDTQEETNRLLTELVAKLAAPKVYEYGFVYEIDAFTNEYQACSSRAVAEAHVAASPTDTGLVRREPGGEWEQVNG